MQTAQNTLSDRIRQGASSAFGAEYLTWDPQLRASTKPEFGHVQTNLPLRLAKTLGLAPRHIAERILAQLNIDDLCLPAQVAGAGFLNFTWRSDLLANQVNALAGDAWLGLVPSPARRVVVDYSSPNVAKVAHVGHLRSSVIGDALARVLRFAGHDVVAQNHVGDWGTQFGMLIEQVTDATQDVSSLTLPALEQLYRQARTRFESDAAFASRARARVVALQSGDPVSSKAWSQLVAVSLGEFDRLYDRLGVSLTPEDVAGESSYNDALPGVVADLLDAGLLTESDGALCAFLPGFSGRDGNALPLIVRKADGGYGYAATDLAAIRHRVSTLGADQLVYVVDARQSLHFDQVFALARAAGWLPEDVSAAHAAFGTVMGPDGKPFKTRSGQTVALSSLLDDAETKAAAFLAERPSDLDEAEKKRLASVVAVGAVKYADLSSGLGRDYVFALDRMVALEGNTGPYLQYAHARLTSLLAKADQTPGLVSGLDHPAEQRLALALTGFGPAVDKVVTTLEPHHLCGYLYQVAVALSAFYEACPVNKADPSVKASRLGLCQATQHVLATGLDMLGIEAPTKM
jgi:arginyl-tRNA synthetase